MLIILLPIPNIFFVILLAALTGYLTFLTTKGSLTDDRYTKTWTRLTKRGKTVFWVLLIIAVLLALQEYNNQLISDNKDQLLNAENEKRDSVVTAGIKAGVDSGGKKLFADISEAFNKQGLRLDTVKKEIERVRDSTKKSIIIYNGAEPFFSLCKENPITLTDQFPDRYVFNLNICNSSAPSRNINAKVYVVSLDSLNQMLLSKEFDLFQSNAQMDKDAEISQQIIVPTERKLQICYFLVKGTWTNVDSSKLFKIDFIYHYNIETKNSGGVTALHDKQIRGFLKTKTNF